MQQHSWVKPHLSPSVFDQDIFLNVLRNFNICTLHINVITQHMELSKWCPNIPSFFLFLFAAWQLFPQSCITKYIYKINGKKLISSAEGLFLWLCSTYTLAKGGGIILLCTALIFTKSKVQVLQICECDMVWFWCFTCSSLLWHLILVVLWLINSSVI